MIKLKQLLEQGWSSDAMHDDNYDLYYITRRIQYIAEQFHEQIESHLGGGANGLAWKLKSGKVLKVTDDSNEIASASRFRTRPKAQHIISYYDVRRITEFWNPKTGPYGRNNPNDWVAIIMDYVTPFDESQKLWWDRYEYVKRAYLDQSIPDAVMVEQIESSFRDTRFKNGPDEYGSAPNVEAANWWKSLMPQRKTVIREFSSFRVKDNEAHGGNMGFDSFGQLVHFDIWSKDQFGYRQTKTRNLNRTIDWTPDSTGIKDI